MNEPTTKQTQQDEYAAVDVKALLLTRARARRDLTHAIHAFCLRYDLMHWFERCRANIGWWREGESKRKTLVEHFKKAYGLD